MSGKKRIRRKKQEKEETGEGNGKKIRVGVWGDVFVNHSIAHKKKSRSGFKFLDRENYVQSSVQLGGAPLFAEIIEMISETDEEIKNNSEYKIDVISNKHTKSFSELQCWHSYSIIDKKGEDEDEKKKSLDNKNDETKSDEEKLADKFQVKGKWRISEYLGRDDRDDDIDEDYKKDDKLGDIDLNNSNKELDILVIIDHNNTPIHSKEEKNSEGDESKKESKLSKLRINEHSNYLKILNKLKKDGKIIYRISAPINQGDLLRQLLDNGYKDNLILIVTAEAFRESEMYISKDLSWERMAKDAFWSIKHNSKSINDIDKDNSGDYSDISKASNIIVTFDSAGALHYQRNKINDEKCWHYFDPISLETRWIMKYPGYTLCRGYCVTASIVLQLIKNKIETINGDTEEGIDLYGKAILAGLEARRDFHEHGYSSYIQMSNYKKKFDSIDRKETKNIGEIIKEIKNLEENLEDIKCKKTENNEEREQLQNCLNDEREKEEKFQKRKFCFYWDTFLVADKIIKHYENIEDKKKKPLKISNNFSYFKYNPNEKGDEKFVYKGERIDDLKLAMDIVKKGFDSHLYSRPLGEFEKFLSADTKEIESFRSIRRLIQEYNKKGDKEPMKPLSIGIFGSPGSGKSYCVKEVVKSVIGKEKGKFISYNLSQMKLGDTNELCEVYHKVRDVMLSGKLPIVFFDEFDCEGLKWLKYFLSPMQDGEFVSDGVTHYIGKSIFVFAGGVFETIKKFSEGTEKAERDLKAPDFASRLKGSVDIVGLNPSDNEAGKINNNFRLDKKYLIKRAILLRSVLWNKHKDLIGGKGAKDREEKLDIKTDDLNIEDSLLYAFLVTKKYHHGIRSLESIVYMSLLSGKHCYRRSYLPSREQLEHHVDANDFLRNIICYNFKNMLQAEDKNYVDQPEWNSFLSRFRKMFNKQELDIESDKYLDEDTIKKELDNKKIKKAFNELAKEFEEIKVSDIEKIFSDLNKYGLFFVNYKKKTASDEISEKQKELGIEEENNIEHNKKIDKIKDSLKTIIAEDILDKGNQLSQLNRNINGVETKLEELTGNIGVQIKELKDRLNKIGDKNRDSVDVE